MRKMGQTAEPRLLRLRGRTDHRVLEDAIAEIKQGDYPEWRVVRESDSKGGGSGGRQVLAAVASLIFGMFNQPSGASGRTIVVEHAPTGRQETVTFDSLGEANGLPLWNRA